MSLNSFIPGDDTKTIVPDGVNGWDYWQDRYGYNLPNQFMNDLQSKFYWDQDTQSWKPLPNNMSAGVGVAPGKPTPKPPTTGSGAGNMNTLPPGQNFGGSTIGQMNAGIKPTSIPAYSAGGSSMGSIAPYAIQAGGSVASSVVGGKSAKEAAAAGERSAAAALAFAREQEATRQAQYAQGFKMWYASQNQLRERYGLPPLPPMEAFPSSTTARGPLGSREAVPAYTNTFGGQESADAREAYKAWVEAGRPPATAAATAATVPAVAAPGAAVMRRPMTIGKMLGELA